MNAASGRDTLRSYVRGTQLVLTAQILASVIAAGATGYMLLQLRPLVAERERLATEVAEADAELNTLKAGRAEVAAALASAKDQLARAETDLAAATIERDALRSDLAGVRKKLEAAAAALEKAEVDRREAEAARTEAEAALAAVRDVEAELRSLVLAQRAQVVAAQQASAKTVQQAIRSFHADDFAAAVQAYQRALQVDPRNPYILNLKSFAEFMSGNLDDAVETLRRSLTIDPTYVWGYFDLMRYQCAAGDHTAALKTLDEAVAAATDGPIDPLFPKNRPSDLLTGATGLKYFLTGDIDGDGYGEGDGQFKRLCRPILPELTSRLEAADSP